MILFAQAWGDEARGDSAERGAGRAVIHPQVEFLAERNSSSIGRRQTVTVKERSKQLHVYVFISRYRLKELGAECNHDMIIVN